MKKIGIIVFKYIYNLVYNIMKMKKIEKKAVLISRQSNNISIDFKMIEEELDKKGIKTVVICKKIEKRIS